MSKIKTKTVINSVEVGNRTLEVDDIWKDRHGGKVIITFLTKTNVGYYSYPIGRDESGTCTHEEFVRYYPYKGKPW